jgi:predicted membrane protein
MTRYTISGFIGLIMSYAPFVVVPIIAYQFHNWWFLFGIIFSLLGTAIGSKKIKFIILALASIVFFALQNYDLMNMTFNFYFLCFFFGILCMILYSKIGFSDKTSRALIAASGNKEAREEIEKEIESGMEKWRAEKAKEKNDDTKE